MGKYESAVGAGARPVSGASLGDEGAMPELSGATNWINSPPLRRQAVLGKLVVIDFWTYSCVNCLRSLPNLRSRAAKYAASDLVVIGIHSPEFAFERDEAYVEQAVRELKLAYPVANDSDHAIWKAFGKRYWPVHYFVDIRGHIGFHHFGEGDYDESEMVSTACWLSATEG